jgi:hypothetical protein
MADKRAPAEAGDLIELVAPAGCDEASHGTTRYRVGDDGRVCVPREAAYHLIRCAGFRPAPPIETAAPRKLAPDADPGAGNGAEEAKPIPAKVSPRPPVPCQGQASPGQAQIRGAKEE